MKCFEPSHPQRIISGLKTNFDLSPVIYSTSHYTTSLIFSNHNSVIYFMKKQTQHTSHFIEHINLSQKDKQFSRYAFCSIQKRKATLVNYVPMMPTKHSKRLLQLHFSSSWSLHWGVMTSCAKKKPKKNLGDPTYLILYTKWKYKNKANFDSLALSFP